MSTPSDTVAPVEDSQNVAGYDGERVALIQERLRKRWSSAAGAEAFHDSAPAEMAWLLDTVLVLQDQLRIATARVKRLEGDMAQASPPAPGSNTVHLHGRVSGASLRHNTVTVQIADANALDRYATSHPLTIGQPAVVTLVIAGGEEG